MRNLNPAQANRCSPIPLRGRLFATSRKVASLVLAGLCFCLGSPLTARASAALAEPRAYDVSAYELAPEWRRGLRPWTRSELKRVLHERVEQEKRRRELNVDYYRIGYTMAYPLKLNRRPTIHDLPAGIPTIVYPWLIWLSWDLEERWRGLHYAWRQTGDREAGRRLQKELAALAGWDQFSELNGQVGLVTGHLAAVLALALADTSGWDRDALIQARAAAEALIERDVWPWFTKNWPEKELGARDLGNIPAIALVRSAQLARVIGSGREVALDARARAVLQAWCRCRLGPEHHTEGTAYDGYFLDSFTEWIEGLPDRDQILRECSAAFRNQADHWIHLVLPGRVDLQAPLGDVEAEMEFWATVLARFAVWYGWSDASWLVHRFPLTRLRAAALVLASNPKAFREPPGLGPIPGLREHANAVSMRTGWDAADLLAVVGLSRGKMGHLHADGGHLILGWQGRFWITDPGYQQYRPGLEQEFTLGTAAHNTPVIGAATQVWREAKALLMETNTSGDWHAVVDASACYRGLPRDALVQRDVRLLTRDGLAVVAADQFSGLGTNVEVTTSWQIGYHLACAFREGWVRLSDGEHAVWMGAFPDALEAAQVTRHPGSRGPLTLTRRLKLPAGVGSCSWVFWFDSKGGWTPPPISMEAGGLRIGRPR